MNTGGGRGPHGAVDSGGEGGGDGGGDGGTDVGVAGGASS